MRLTDWSKNSQDGCDVVEEIVIEHLRSVVHDPNVIRLIDCRVTIAQLNFGRNCCAGQIYPRRVSILSCRVGLLGLASHSNISPSTSGWTGDWRIFFQHLGQRAALKCAVTVESIGVVLTLLDQIRDT